MLLALAVLGLILAWLPIRAAITSSAPPRAPALDRGPIVFYAPTNSPTERPSTTPTVSATATPEPPPTLPPPPPTDPPPAIEPSLPPPAPQPTPVRGGTVLPLPDGVSVIWGGCASDGSCNDYNFYWAPTHEVVMQYGEGPHKVQHEFCHAHQHWSINGGAALAPSDYDLESWYGTAEGQSFTSAVAGLSWPWSHSQVNGIEDFAWTCAYWYFDAAYLLEVSPTRYDWAAANLP